MVCKHQAPLGLLTHFFKLKSSKGVFDGGRPDLHQSASVCWQVPRLVLVPSVGSIRAPSKELSSRINATI